MVEDLITKYWGFITSIVLLTVGGITAWVKMNDRMDAHEKQLEINGKRIDKLDQQAEQTNTTFTAIKVDLAEIKTSQDFIKVQIASLVDKFVK